MGRISALRSGGNLRQLLLHNSCRRSRIPPPPPPPPYLIQALISSEPKISSSSSSLFSTFAASTTFNTALLSQHLLQNRTLSSTPSAAPGPSNIVLVKSEEELNKSLSQAQDECLPAVFYFTAVWCGP